MKTSSSLELEKTKSANQKKAARKSSRKIYLSKTWELYLMLLIPCIYFLVFKYLPIYKTRIAFVDFNMFASIADSPWNNFEHFKELFSQTLFFNALRNTITLNLLDLLFGFPIPIIIALLLNEVHNEKLKRITQTIIYIPHFLSWVIIAGIVFQVFSSSGIVNVLITKITGGEPVPFLKDAGKWIAIYVGTGVWQSAGYATIIYLAALTNVDPSLYEAAYVDGAGKLRRIVSITLPCIKSTIVMMLILQVGKLMSISFDRPFMLGNPLVNQVSEVISTYVYRVGLQGMRFDYAAAVGLFQSVAAFTILIIANNLAKKIGEEGIM